MAERHVANRELDARIANEVMGQVPCDKWRYANLGSAGGPVSMNDGCAHRDGGCYPADANLPFGGPPKYTTHFAAAMELVEYMRRRGYDVAIHDQGEECDPKFKGQPWYTMFTKIGSTGMGVAPTLPLSICFAALRTVTQTAGRRSPEEAP